VVNIELTRNKPVREIDASRTHTSVFASLRELFAHRALLRAWAVRELTVRYKQTGLGALWAILQPISMMLLFSFVFTLIVRVDTGDIAYPVFSYTALLPWTFFTTSVSFGTQSLVGNLNLVQKIYFPREVLPLASIVASLVDLLIASSVFVLLLLFFDQAMTWRFILVPVILLFQIVLTTGVVLIASALNVFFRDLRFVIPLGLQLLLYATPIIYPVSSVPVWLKPAYMLNPMAVYIESYRAVILYGELPQWGYLAVAALISLTLAIVGYYWFKRMEVRFADII
jgi:lipopolysaccharide transport system permease protein